MVAERRKAAAAAALIALTFSGCSAAPVTQADDPHSSTTIPKFSGPYADDFTRAYEHAGSDKVRRILADGRISAQEFAEARAGTSACMKDNGYYIKWESGGGFEVGAADEKYPDDFQKKMNPVLEACEHKNDGEITLLYQETTRNPRNEDPRRDIVKCLAEKNLVPKEYSVRDYDHDSDDGSYPFSEFDPKGRACIDDPLGVEPEGL